MSPSVTPSENSKAETDTDTDVLPVTDPASTDALEDSPDEAAQADSDAGARSAADHADTDAADRDRARSGYVRVPRPARGEVSDVLPSKTVDATADELARLRDAIRADGE